MNEWPQGLSIHRLPRWQQQQQHQRNVKKGKKCFSNTNLITDRRKRWKKCTSGIIWFIIFFIWRKYLLFSMIHDVLKVIERNKPYKVMNHLLKLIKLYSDFFNKKRKEYWNEKLSFVTLATKSNWRGVLGEEGEEMESFKRVCWGSLKDLWNF